MRSQCRANDQEGKNDSKKEEGIDMKYAKEVGGTRRIPMKKASFALIGALILVLLPGPAFVADGDDDDFQELAEEIQEACDTEEVVEVMQEAAEEAGVSIDTEGILIASRHSTSSSLGMSVVAAGIEGFQDIPATELPNGVDFGFLFFDGVSPDLPSDFYTLRVTALEPVGLGEIDGLVEFINPQGDVTFQVVITIEVDSLVIGAFEVTKIEIRIEFLPSGKIKITLDYICSNGYSVKTVVITVGC